MGRVQSCTTFGEEGEGEANPVRQVERQQQWGDLSGRPSLRGAKGRLSPAWVLKAGSPQHG